MWNVISTESSTLNSFFYKYAILRAYKIYLVHYLPIIWFPLWLWERYWDYWDLAKIRYISKIYLCFKYVAKSLQYFTYATNKY